MTRIKTEAILTPNWQTESEPNSNVQVRYMPNPN
jgi:hypothetical protein